MKIAVTGANSSVGQSLLSHIATQSDISVIAGVRSEKAMASLPTSAQIDARLISYDDEAGLANIFEGVDCVIHLAGILIESRHSTYESANVAATSAVVAAAKRAAVKRIVFISVIGASPDSDNLYLKSKGLAENIVMLSGLTACVIRTPILLGPGTAGADSLIGVASQSRPKVLGGGHYTMRPLDVDDLCLAILQGCNSQADEATVYELVGPEAVPYRELVRRTANLMGRETEIGSIPIWLAKIIAAIASRIKGAGITPAVIDVITADEVVQTNADATLGISLTPLNTTLSKILKQKHTT